MKILSHFLAIATLLTSTSLYAANLKHEFACISQLKNSVPPLKKPTLINRCETTKDIHQAQNNQDNPFVTAAVDSQPTFFDRSDILLIAADRMLPHQKQSVFGIYEFNEDGNMVFHPVGQTQIDGTGTYNARIELTSKNRQYISVRRRICQPNIVVWDETKAPISHPESFQTIEKRELRGDTIARQALKNSIIVSIRRLFETFNVESEERKLSEGTIKKALPAHRQAVFYQKFQSTYSACLGLDEQIDRELNTQSKLFQAKDIDLQAMVQSIAPKSKPRRNLETSK